MLEQLSPYEKMRLERIKRNEERMRELGLDKYPLLFSKKKKQTTPPNKKKQPARVVTPGQERRSQRNQKRKKPIESQNDHFSSDDEVDEDDEVDVRRPYRKRRLLLDPVDYRLSSADRAALEGAADENFMGKFQEFLEFHDKISPANVKNVMRQARKLASGEGIRYEVRTVPGPTKRIPSFVLFARLFVFFTTPRSIDQAMFSFLGFAPFPTRSIRFSNLFCFHFVFFEHTRSPIAHNACPAQNSRPGTAGPRAGTSRKEPRSRP